MVWRDRVVTVDTLVEGTHFDRRWTPAEVGFKSVAASVADLAAMGAVPSWAVLALTLPPRPDAAWVTQFASGLGRACRRWGLSLVGGDTTRGPAAVVTVTLGGRLVGAPLRRDGARAGDDIWVSGTLGAAGCGWQHPSPPVEAWQALTQPRPPLPLALALARLGLAASAMDLSDGLAIDLPRLMTASGTGARVHTTALPVASCATLDQALGGGEDHQLLFTARPHQRAALQRLGTAHGVTLSHIGEVCAEPELLLDGAGWPTVGFAHFGESP